MHLADMHESNFPSTYRLRVLDNLTPASLRMSGKDDSRKKIMGFDSEEDDIQREKSGNHVADGLFGCKE